jgi:lysophospholipase
MGFSDRPLPDRLKMHVDSFDHYVQDLRIFLETVVKAGGRRLLYVLGHSTGALIAALYMQTNPQTFRAGVFCSPFFDVGTEPVPGFVNRALARMLDLPGRHREYGPGQREIVRPDFNSNQITNSFARWSLWEQDIIPNNEAIQFGGVTNHWLRESLIAGHRAVREAGKISVPLLVLQAGQESIVRSSAQNRFCRKARRCTMMRMTGAKHEILIERDPIRNEAITRIKAFLLEQMRES